LALAGALAGFVVYNLPPARIYLGDCGSMIIGFALALLAGRVAFGGSGRSGVIALMLLFLPLFDTALAIVRRTLSGQSFMAADRGHVHHRLLDRGFCVWRVLAVLGGICVTTGAVAYFASAFQAELWAWGTLATITVVSVRWQLAGHQEWALAKRAVLSAAVRLVTQGLRADAPPRLRVVSLDPVAGNEDDLAESAAAGPAAVGSVASTIHEAPQPASSLVAATTRSYSPALGETPRVDAA